jgi:hypothetical protein
MGTIGLTIFMLLDAGGETERKAPISGSFNGHRDVVKGRNSSSRYHHGHDPPSCAQTFTQSRPISPSPPRCFGRPVTDSGQGNASCR